MAEESPARANMEFIDVIIAVAMIRREGVVW